MEEWAKSTSWHADILAMLGYQNEARLKLALCLWKIPFEFSVLSIWQKHKFQSTVHSFGLNIITASFSLSDSTVAPASTFVPTSCSYSNLEAALTVAPGLQTISNTVFTKQAQTLALQSSSYIILIQSAFVHSHGCVCG